jgi:hypothetical protein
LGAWAHDWSQLAAARRTLRTHRPHTLRGGFSDAFARRAHGALESAALRPAWSCSAPTRNTFAMMRRCVIEERRAPAPLAAALEPLHAPALARLISALAGVTLDGSLEAEATWFRTDDHLSLHEDAQSYRRVAFAWHLHAA